MKMKTLMNYLISLKIYVKNKTPEICLAAKN